MKNEHETNIKVYTIIFFHEFFLLSNLSLATSWAYPFVVWDG
ncbi:hypothetical protein [Chengkuizengella axinellae]|uniref:Uncharacterized protein n=1 Tax=Chengkuizengella axinellae TaxID=3064388 RepID=A0ABT9IY33_9BACL|nr:hypothetical protein [Chengkuizengella sp. 2205SS18-9]MDP5274235.1 hypothetical protein [Chengkuizengella sp. 2205SS18-9]